MRGQLTPVVQQIAKDGILHREITVTELRLIPYVHYLMANEQRIDPRKINQEEREILAKWREEGWIQGGASGLSMCKDFYDFASEIVWEAYVVGGATDAWTEAVSTFKGKPVQSSGDEQDTPRSVIAKSDIKKLPAYRSSVKGWYCSKHHRLFTASNFGRTDCICCGKGFIDCECIIGDVW